MRDYSFGNFVSALRERRGLSQYQLGALVGVSDKAVSKWENGVSKPRMNILKKIADVLDISVGELLSCEYDTFEEERKDLFAMKKEIIKKAKAKMLELYGMIPDVRISNRFKMEEVMLSGQDTLLWMGFFSELKRVCWENHTFFSVRGAQLGASFIAWLLGVTDVNPLQAHYYCPECKKIEFLSDEKCGLDAPDQICNCGHIYYKDGFDIDAMNMYPFNNWYEINVEANTTELVVSCLKGFFKGYGEIKELRIADADSEKIEISRNYKHTQYVLLSRELAKKYLDSVITLLPEKDYSFCQEHPSITIVENQNPGEFVQKQMSINEQFTEADIQTYVKQAFSSGKFQNDIYSIDLNQIVSRFSHPKLQDMIVVSGLLYSAGAWADNGEILFQQDIPLEELIYCREDLYQYLYKKLQEKCCDNPVGIALEIKEQVRKGVYAHKGMPEEIEKLLLECDVPEWYVDNMKKIQYLFPKTQLITMMKYGAW